MSFRWGTEQEEAFLAVKRVVVENALMGGNPERQYHLATDVSGTGLGGVLF
jgi:microcompartment protein CcmK/EutM